MFSLCVFRDLASQLQALVKRMKNDPVSLYTILLGNNNNKNPSFTAESGNTSNTLYAQYKYHEQFQLKAAKAVEKSENAHFKLFP